jgi:ketopantoate reductase
VTTKATQLDTALDRVPPEVLDGALLVPLLNGVEHLALLLRAAARHGLAVSMTERIVTELRSRLR